MLPAKIANLTCLGACDIARGGFTSLIRIEMRESPTAIAVGGDRLIMKMVHSIGGQPGVGG